MFGEDLTYNINGTKVVCKNNLFSIIWQQDYSCYQLNLIESKILNNINKISALILKNQCTHDNKDECKTFSKLLTNLLESSAKVLNLSHSHKYNLDALATSSSDSKTLLSFTKESHVSISHFHWKYMLGSSILFGGIFTAMTSFILAKGKMKNEEIFGFIVLTALISTSLCFTFQLDEQNCINHDLFLDQCNNLENIVNEIHHTNLEIEQTMLGMHTQLEE